MVQSKCLVQKLHVFASTITRNAVLVLENYTQSGCHGVRRLCLTVYFNKVGFDLSSRGPQLSSAEELKGLWTVVVLVHF